MATRLTGIQAGQVARAREALEAARAERAFDTLTLAGHVGALGWHVSELLCLIAELTGGER